MAIPLPSKIRVRVSSKISIHLLFFFFIFFFNLFISPSFSFSYPYSSVSRIPYSQYCSSIVPESIPNNRFVSTIDFPQLKNGYYIGGENILSGNLQSWNNFPKSVNFRNQNVYKTNTDGVLMVEGVLIFRVGNSFPVLSNFTYEQEQSNRSRFRTRRHRFPVRRDRLTFNLRGFWSESSGKLCMVGSGSWNSKEGNLLDLSAVFKLNYPKNSTLLTSLISGTLESLKTVDSVNYFEPISVLAFSQRNYEYTLISKENESGFSGVDDVQKKNSSLSLKRGRNICSELFRPAGYKLEYVSDCDVAKNCSPLGRNIGFLPNFMYFNEVQCSADQKLRLLIEFSNTSYRGYNQPMVPNTALVGEGVWDGDNNRLCLVACRILNFTDTLVSTSVGDCSIKLSLWFPAIVSIKSRSSVVGQIWSNRTMSESGYFDRIVIQSTENRLSGVPGLKYEYTESDRVMKFCPDKPTKKKGRRYPDGYSYDMKFNTRVRNKQGINAWGYLVPLFVGNEFYEQSLSLLPIAMTPESAVQENEPQNSLLIKPHKTLLNISYSISFTPGYNVHVESSSINTSLNLNTPIEISAEGIYNIETGSLCMIGCRHLGSNHGNSSKHYSMDCEILIKIQFRPLNSKSSDYVKGTIESTRKGSDPLYFERLELFSISLTSTQAAESVLRMDLEITMVLISNTLICIFVGLQIFYVKKHPDILPSISLVMLVILTLGYMIPLVLNFEAMFLTNHNRQNVSIGNGGWLEVNEVIVRIVTMVAFLLQFRLLQLTWSARSVDGNQKSFVLAEKKALYVLLPLYLFGALIAWIMHWQNTYHEAHYYRAPFRHGRSVAGYLGHSLWGDLRSYGGLLLDGFLLPQILFNVFWNSKDMALYPAFYVGTTAVRVLPHAYDLYRAHRYIPYIDASYIYANPVGDFFSTAWDVIIPCGGLLFAIVICLQQRFGGCCILPQIFRQSAMYEKVPTASGE